MRRLKIEHLTTYQFGASVELGPHKLLIRPREGHDVRIESSSLQIEPASTVKWHRDFYGNSVGIARFSERSTSLRINSEVIIQHFEENPFDFLLDPSAANYPFKYDPDEEIDLSPYQSPCFSDPRGILKDWVDRFWKPGSSLGTFALLNQMNQSISRDFAYAKRDAPGVQPPTETLQYRRGSCRDFATLFIEGCRTLGMAARFASGYLCNQGASEPGGSTHAWAEVYLPGAGWRGFDSTSGEVTGTSHIAAAVSRHPSAVPPVSGSFTGPAGLSTTLWVGVKVAFL